MKFISAGPAFIDTVDALNFEFKEDTSNTAVILGAYHYSTAQHMQYPDLHKQFDKVIIFNQEQLHAKQRNFMTPEYANWLQRADEVWDYDEANFDILNQLNKNVKLHLLKPYKDWSKYQPVEKDIDILFYGAMNGYRSYLLSKLSEKYHVCVLQGEWNRLDEFILRSKILLNIHFYYECALQEQARMIRWIGAPCRIISEKSKKNYLNVEEKTYEELLKL